jgi:hypothetical protein
MCPINDGLFETSLICSSITVESESGLAIRPASYLHPQESGVQQSSVRHESSSSNAIAGSRRVPERERATSPDGGVEGVLHR